MNTLFNPISFQSLQGIFDLDAKDQMLLLNALCFRRQKLAESRTEGAVSEPSKEGIAVLKGLYILLLNVCTT